MATVIGIANTGFAGEELEQFVEAVGSAVTASLRLAPHLKSVSLFQLPQANSTKKEYTEITFFVYTAPNKPVEAKRDLVRNIQAAAEPFFAAKEKVVTIVIIKEHSDENVGVAGQLRLDLG